MSILIGFLYVIEVVVCLLLALVVMLQKPKEGGLGGAIGGGMLETSLGADAGTVLVKATATLGAIFLINTLVLARLTSVQNSHSLMANVSEAAPAKAAPALPIPQTAPAKEAATAPVPTAKAPVPTAKAPVPSAKAPVPPAKAPVPPVKAPAAPAKPVAK